MRRAVYMNGLFGPLPDPPDTRLVKAIAKLEEIVCTTGEDAGVIYKSQDSPTVYDPQLHVQVYQYQHFSELGDALIELHQILKGEL